MGTGSCQVCCIASCLQTLGTKCVSEEETSAFHPSASGLLQEAGQLPALPVLPIQSSLAGAFWSLGPVVYSEFAVPLCWVNI